MTNDLKHVGVLGMHWGQRKSKTSGSKQSHFSRSLEQKYGHKTVSSLYNSVKPKVLNTVKTVVKAYAAYKVTELVVGSIPKIAWATGKVISTAPLH